MLIRRKGPRLHHLGCLVCKQHTCTCLAGTGRGDKPQNLAAKLMQASQMPCTVCSHHGVGINIFLVTIQCKGCCVQRICNLCSELNRPGAFDQAHPPVHLSVFYAAAGVAVLLPVLDTDNGQLLLRAVTDAAASSSPKSATRAQCLQFQADLVATPVSWGLVGPDLLTCWLKVCWLVERFACACACKHAAWKPGHPVCCGQSSPSVLQLICTVMEDVIRPAPNQQSVTQLMHGS